MTCAHTTPPASVIPGETLGMTEIVGYLCPECREDLPTGLAVARQQAHDAHLNPDDAARHIGRANALAKFDAALRRVDAIAAGCIDANGEPSFSSKQYDAYRAAVAECNDLKAFLDASKYMSRHDLTAALG